jgi:hypothetical protein
MLCLLLPLVLAIYNVDPGRSGILAVPAPHQNFIFSILFKLQLNNQNNIKLTI